MVALFNFFYADASMTWHFGQKLALVMSLLVVVASAILGYSLVIQQFRLMEEQFNRNGITVSSQLSAASVELLFTDDHLSLGSLVFSLVEQESVLGAGIANREGETVATSGVVFPALESHYQAREAVQVSQNSERVWFVTPVSFRGVQGGVAWVGLDKSDIIARQQAAIRTSLIVVALLVLAISLLAVRLGRSLARPVQDLKDAAHAIANGQLSFRVREPQPVEFRPLTRAFNEMAAGLEQKQRVERLFSRFVSDPVAARYLARDEIVLHQEGHRVEASILFVDLVGYTAFSEGRDPEQVAEVLNRYFTEFADACHQYSGTVDKYIGDCAMLLFGCPQPDPEHRFHAMQAALAIRDRVERLNVERAEQGLPVLQIRVGLSSGTVLAGLLGSYERLQYTVVGAPANLASRLCDLALPGQVLTDEAFYLALSHRHPLNVDTLQSIEVKGFSLPVKMVAVRQWQADNPDLHPSSQEASS